ncbi:leukotoxin LktA family filamentous adhesin [bacterium]|nr:leukotoxin LktA family filamentous adhesin [bacterium]
MQETRFRKGLQRGVALTSVVTFLMMPVNVVYANDITQGNSGVGSLTDIKGGQSNVTDITSGFVQNGTGINHFGKFNVDGKANLLGANRYVNMVDTMANINGILNAFQKTGQLPANVMFISPEGMAIGANGVLNVGGLQMITPSYADYKSLVDKAGKPGDPITAIMLKEADFEDLKAGGNGLITIDGKVYSAGDVVIQAGNGIYFQDGSIISTTKGASTIGDISLFTNTGDILDLGSNGEVRLDSNGNITISAKQGGVGEMMLYNQELNYGEATTVLPLNVKVAEGKKLNVEVSQTTGAKGSYKGYASVANNSANLNLGTVKGANVKIVNKGHGTLTTTEAITDVGKVYLNAQNGYLNINEDITAKEIVRLNGDVGVESAGNLTVTDNGYVSVYSEDGGIDVNDVTLKSGNIDIKAKGGDVSVGNVTIQERGAAEGTLRLVDNKKLSTGIKAPDTFRFDGVHIVSENDNIVQKQNTQINSAGRVDLTAAGSIDSTVKAVDLISATGGETTLKTLDTARLGDVTVSKLTVDGNNILVDGKITSKDRIDITATDKVTIRPQTYLDETHRTYGVINAENNINITAENGILATEQRPVGAMINVKEGDINLNTKGDIKALGSDDKITLSMNNGKVNANADNVNLHLVDGLDYVGTINANKDANIKADGKIVVKDIISAGQNLAVDAAKDIEQSTQGVAFKSGKDMTLNSKEANVGQPENYLSVEVGNNLEATALNGGVYINGNGDLTVSKAEAGKDVKINATKDLNANNVFAGNQVELAAGKDAVTKNVVAPNGITIKAENNLSADNLRAEKGDITIAADKGAAQVTNADALGLNPDAGVSSGHLVITAGTTAKVDNVNGSSLLSVSAENGITAGYAISGDDIVLNTNGNLVAEELRAVADIEMNVGGSADIDYARAQNNVNANIGDELKMGTIIGIDDVNLTAGSMVQSTKEGADGVYAYENVNLKATAGDIASKDNKLKVQAKTGEVNAETKSDAANIHLAILEDTKVGTVEATKDVTIDAEQNLMVNNLVKAGNDLEINAQGSIEQKKAGEVTFKSGNDMTLNSATNNVGNSEKYLQVSVGGELNAQAPQGGVYIGTPDDVTIGKIAAGKDVVVDATGSILQSDTIIQKPAIKAGEDITLKSAKEDIGAKDNFLTVDFGGELDVESTQGSAYIEGMGALNVDDVKAALDLGLRTPEDIVADKVSAGRDLILESGKNVEINVAEAGRDVNVKAEEALKVTDIKAGEDIRLESGEDMTIVDLKANKDAEIVSGGKVKVENLLEAGEDLKVEATKDIEQKGQEVAFKSGNDMTLESKEANVGQPENYLSVEVGGKLDAEAEKAECISTEMKN